MPAWSYVALENSGKQRSGRIESPDRQSALQELKGQGVRIIRLEEFKGSIWTRELAFGTKKIPMKELVPFLRQFAVLVRAGVTLVDALRILAEQTTHKPLRTILVDAASQVMRGSQLSDVLRAYPREFPPLLPNMIRAGEVTGNLEDVLERLAQMMEKENYVREKVKSAMTYPIIVSILAVLVAAFLLINVIPTFVQNLLALGGQLPLPTQIVLATSEHLQAWWYLYAGGLLLSWLGLRAISRTERGRYAFDLLKLKLPVFGPLLQKAAIARTSRTLSAMFQSAVPTLQAFTVAAGVVGNEVYARALLKARDALTEGQSLVLPLRAEPMFPPLVTQMIAIGEQTGSLDVMFAKIADFYEADVEAMVDKLRPLLEPLMILVLAVVVGVIITAALAPVFEIYNQMGQHN